MDIQRFKENIIPILLNPQGDSPFSSFRILTHGMAGIRTAKLINFGCRCMDLGEFYLEVGTFSGYTLISAGYQTNTICIGIDDFSMKEIIKKDSIPEARKLISNELKKNMQEFASNNTRFIESSFRDIQLSDESKGKLALLFIDGDHTFKEVKETMEKFLPYFSKDSVIIFDDVQYGGIPDYIQMMMKDYELLAYLKSTVHPHDEKVHQNMPLDEHIANGICVMARKN